MREESEAIRATLERQLEEDIRALRVSDGVRITRSLFDSFACRSLAVQPRADVGCGAVQSGIFLRHQTDSCGQSKSVPI